jgi:polyhydroxyalkanoate synthase
VVDNRTPRSDTPAPGRSGAVTPSSDPSPAADKARAVKPKGKPAKAVAAKSASGVSATRKASAGKANSGKAGAAKAASQKAPTKAPAKAQPKTKTQTKTESKPSRQAEQASSQSKPKATAAQAAPTPPPAPTSQRDDATASGAKADAGKKAGSEHKAGSDRKAEQPRDNTIPAPDIEALTRNMAQFYEEAGKATAAYLKPLEERRGHVGAADEMSDMVKTLVQVTEKWLIDPQKAVEAQSRLGLSFMDIWANSLRRMQGEEVAPAVPTDPKDGRFKDEDWSSNAYFDMLKQAYLATSRWAEEMVDEADDIDEATRHKARFYVKQLAGALSPSNFLTTNPEVIRETFKESGANLARGMKMLAEDIEAGHGELKIRQTDASKFKVGENMANTPGKVVFRNDLIELIQYTPTTEKVLARPLLIVPPWINKFYILDLNADKSFIRWAVSQGLTVFCISWVNPDGRHRDKGFGDYMREGIFAALEQVETITGERQVSAIGYCVGGTLLSVALAYMAASKDDRIASATLFTTQVDFTHAGDLKIFANEDQIRAIEQNMEARGYLDGGRMASAFNMLRPNDLIWPYVVNNYLKGKDPFAFDLLYWNSDSTRMPAANHSYYLRNCYLENNLSQGRAVLDGVRLDLSKVKIPIYNLATREDHIAPAISVFLGSSCFGGPVEYVLAGSGHIAGVVNPPAKPKYQYWTNGPPVGTLEDWIAGADEHPGTWWPHWFEWVRAKDSREVPAREPGGGKVTPICDAPGTYVLMRA